VDIPSLAIPYFLIDFFTAGNGVGAGFSELVSLIWANQYKSFPNFGYSGDLWVQYFYCGVDMGLIGVFLVHVAVWRSG
jgi:hypothetical protein